MGKKAWAIRILAGAAMFGAGFLVRTAWDGYEDRQQALAAQEAAAEAAAAAAEEEALAQREAEAAGECLTADVVQVRIQDGQVQWYDGRLWHEAASVEELERTDRFALAEAAFRELDEQLRQEKAALRQQEAAGAAEKGALAVGRKETPKPPARPQTSVAPGAQTEAPAPEAGAGAAEGGSGGGNSGGGNPGGGNPNPGNPNPGAPNPGSGSVSGGTNVAPPEVPVNPGDSGGSAGGDAGSDTGDGENMEWSDDYL